MNRQIELNKARIRSLERKIDKQQEQIDNLYKMLVKAGITPLLEE